MIAPRVESREPTAVSFDKEFLLETIVFDLNWTGLQIATIATLINACVARSEGWTLHAWRHVQQENIKPMLLALRYGGEIGLAGDITKAIATLYGEVGPAKAAIAPLMQSSAPYRNSEREALARARDAWRRLALAASRAIGALSNAAGGLVNSVSVRDGKAIMRFLDDAAKGDCARVKSTGEIALPVLEQRRRAPRMRVSVGCKIEWDGDSAAATIEDVSREGVGVSCPRPPAEGCVVVLALEDGRRLRANVIRRIGDRAGLRLETRLATSDPLFARSGVLVRSRV